MLKGKRKAYELDWASLVSGDAALTAALNATLAKGSGSASSNHTSKANEESPALRTTCSAEWCWCEGASGSLRFVWLDQSLRFTLT